MSENRSGATLAFLSWAGALLQFIAAHYSMLLSVSCGLAALGASIYSIKASRAKVKFYLDKDSKPSNDENE